MERAARWLVESWYHHRFKSNVENCCGLPLKLRIARSGIYHQTTAHGAGKVENGADPWWCSWNRSDCGAHRGFLGARRELYMCALFSSIRFVREARVLRWFCSNIKSRIKRVIS
ncbi:hypothetical protein QL285_062270 [Trifolium repens]|nr:hypothetical protein QL285_062270 [Trifolium repens]